MINKRGIRNFQISYYDSYARDFHSYDLRASSHDTDTNIDVNIQFKHVVTESCNIE